MLFAKRDSVLSAELALAFVVSGAVCGGSALAAVQPDLNSSSSGNKPTFICMTKAGTGPDGRAHTHRIRVQEKHQQKMQGKGFQLSDCGHSEKWLRTTGPSMCELADISDSAFLDQFRATHGLTPQEICELYQELPAKGVEG